MFEQQALSQLNLLRADQKDFQYTAVRLEIEKAQKIEDLYNFADQFLPTPGISTNAIRYYADVVMFIGELTEMWSGFTHRKDRYTKVTAFMTWCMATKQIVQSTQ